MEKCKKHYYLSPKTIEYINHYAKEKNIKPSIALDQICEEHQNQNDDLLEQIKSAVREVTKIDLERIRAGTNSTDKQTKMLLELMNHHFVVHKYKNLISTEQLKSPGIIEAEKVVQDRISNQRIKKLERERTMSDSDS
ncbi:hypothetical protein [Paenibacillus larvae]|uniref:Uncharacterized protein n=1 Tax=Paenibacillus larvae subsp. larvae TaxID=147375 RepID=A0A2L1U7E0_9BACL|nr:hypothetical protein [Paenibacillus larvae]AVF28840.1 hypothetical protein ERICIII_04836 [Paenibacillus larvae subsp. larvae]MCY9500302.1 hypothetical protein [Paenibacillus larvae]MDR5608738.1 hypothetical protein [Paenibacillus larvae]